LREEEIPNASFTDASGKPLKIKVGRGRDSLAVDPTGPAIAHPVYEGRMVGQLDFSAKGWVSGSGRTAVWQELPWLDKSMQPQYVMGRATYEWSAVLSYLEGIKKQFGSEEYQEPRERLNDPNTRHRWMQSRSRRVAFMDVTSATNERTMIAGPATPFPYGNSAPVFCTGRHAWQLTVTLDSFAFDAVARARCSGLHLNWFVVEEAALPKLNPECGAITDTLSKRLVGCSQLFAPYWQDNSQSWRSQWATSRHERLRLRCQLEAVISVAYGLTTEDVEFILSFCDHLSSTVRDNSTTSKWPSKGFWRVDKGSHPEHRLTILSLIAFHDLQAKIAAFGGDVERGIEAFCNQNDGEGWMLPETLQLADYGLGHDDRAREHQPVRECFGPRFYEWQLAQSPEESWRECHLHARNLLGPDGHQALLEELEGNPVDGKRRAGAAAGTKRNGDLQQKLF